MSGLSRTPGKRVWVYPHRGFESRLLRHLDSKNAHLRRVFHLYLPSDLGLDSSTGCGLVWWSSLFGHFNRFFNCRWMLEGNG